MAGGLTNCRRAAAFKQSREVTTYLARHTTMQLQNGTSMNYLNMLSCWLVRVPGLGRVQAFETRKRVPAIPNPATMSVTASCCMEDFLDLWGILLLGIRIREHSENRYAESSDLEYLACKANDLIQAAMQTLPAWLIGPTG